MKRILAAAAVAAAVLLGSTTRAAAQTTTPTVYAFTTVDAIKVQTDRLLITGILAGSSTPTTRTLMTYSTATSAHLENCQRLAMLAMTKPGAYVFEVSRPYSGASFDACELKRVTP